MIYSYRRVSTEEQHNGPAAQADSINRWCNNENQNINCFTLARCYGVDFFDNGISGSIPLKDRPQGSELLRIIKKGDTVVTSKLDRLFRSVADAAATIDDWTKRGITLVAIAEGFDMTSPYGRAMAQMASVFAELERAMIRERTKAALAAKKARGECVGQVPYGWYKSGPGCLTQYNEEQRIIGLINEMKQRGATTASIAMSLNHEGFPAKNGGKWHATQVRRILERKT